MFQVIVMPTVPAQRDLTPEVIRQAECKPPRVKVNEPLQYRDDEPDYIHLSDLELSHEDQDESGTHAEEEEDKNNAYLSFMEIELKTPNKNSQPLIQNKHHGKVRPHTRQEESGRHTLISKFPISKPTNVDTSASTAREGAKTPGSEAFADVLRQFRAVEDNRKRNCFTPLERKSRGIAM